MFSAIIIAIGSIIIIKLGLESVTFGPVMAYGLNRNHQIGRESVNVGPVNGEWANLNNKGA